MVMTLLEIVIAFGLFILKGFAHKRAGMNHHAIYKRMWLYNSFIEKYRLFWAIFIIVLLVIWLKSYGKISFFTLVSLFLILSLALLLFLPMLRNLTIYYYLYLSNLTVVLLHLLIQYLTKEIYT